MSALPVPYPGKRGSERLQRLQAAGVLAMKPIRLTMRESTSAFVDVRGKDGTVKRKAQKAIGDDPTDIRQATAGIGGMATIEELAHVPFAGPDKGRLFVTLTKGGPMADGRRAHMTEIITAFEQRVHSQRRSNRRLKTAPVGKGATPRPANQVWDTEFQRWIEVE